MARRSIALAVCIAILACMVLAILSPSRSFASPSSLRGRTRSFRTIRRAVAAKEAEVEPQDPTGEHPEMMGGEMEEDDDQFDALEEPPEDVLDEWHADPMAREILLSLFQNESLEGDVITFRDTYKLLEVVGVDREEFVSYFADGPEMGDGEEDHGHGDEGHSHGDGKECKDGDKGHGHDGHGEKEQLVRTKVRYAEALLKRCRKKVRYAEALLEAALEHYEEQLRSYNPAFEPVDLATFGQFLPPKESESEAESEAVASEMPSEQSSLSFKDVKRGLGLKKGLGLKSGIKKMFGGSKSKSKEQNEGPDGEREESTPQPTPRDEQDSPAVDANPRSGRKRWEMRME